MPSGDNMFYEEQEAGHNYYGEFIGKELVEITRKMFPLSSALLTEGIESEQMTILSLQKREPLPSAFSVILKKSKTVTRIRNGL